MIKFFCFAQHEILYIPYFSQLGKFYTIAEVFSITDTSPCKRRHATYICNECDNLSIKIDWQLLCCRVLCFMGLPFGQNKSRSGAWEVGAFHVRTQGCTRQHLSHFCSKFSVAYWKIFVNIGCFHKAKKCFSTKFPIFFIKRLTFPLSAVIIRQMNIRPSGRT